MTFTGVISKINIRSRFHGQDHKNLTRDNPRYPTYSLGFNHANLDTRAYVYMRKMTHELRCLSNLYPHRPRVLMNKMERVSPEHLNTGRKSNGNDDVNQCHIEGVRSSLGLQRWA